MKVKKAVIPAAGLGTRFLPATKTIPKEMLPIVDTPTLFYVVQEAIAAGIEDIIIVAGRNKTAIEDFFDRSYELEDTLEKSGKTELLKMIRDIQSMVNIISIRQKEAKGLGHAVYTAQPIVGDQPFAVLLGDELTFPLPGKKETVTQQLAQVYEQHQMSTVAVMEVPEQDVSKYGIVAVQGNSPMKITEVIEKPQPSQAPSRWALPGRYIFTGRIFDILKNTKPGKNGEIQLTDGMTQVAKEQGMIAHPFVAQRYDAGDKFGYLQANIELALNHPEVGQQLKAYLKNLVKTL